MAEKKKVKTTTGKVDKDSRRAKKGFQGGREGRKTR